MRNLDQYDINFEAILNEFLLKSLKSCLFSWRILGNERKVKVNAARFAFRGLALVSNRLKTRPHVEATCSSWSAL